MAGPSRKHRPCGRTGHFSFHTSFPTCEVGCGQHFPPVVNRRVHWTSSGEAFSTGNCDFYTLCNSLPHAFFTYHLKSVWGSLRQIAQRRKRGKRRAGRRQQPLKRTFQQVDHGAETLFQDPPAVLSPQCGLTSRPCEEESRPWIFQHSHTWIFLLSCSWCLFQSRYKPRSRSSKDD